MLTFCNLLIRVELSRIVKKTQSGVIRTNCLECTDRTNVFQAKACARLFEDILPPSAGGDNTLTRVMLKLWHVSGDYISKIYSGTCPNLTSMLSSGRLGDVESLHLGNTSLKRLMQ